MNVLEALDKHKGVTNHSYKPSLILKVVFPLITFANTDLVIHTLKINLQEDISVDTIGTLILIVVSSKILTICNTYKKKTIVDQTRNNKTKE